LTTNDFKDEMCPTLFYVPILGHNPPSHVAYKVHKY
jgi:hypothetical protein